jgi:hypothetical protein
VRVAVPPDHPIVDALRIDPPVGHVLAIARIAPVSSAAAVAERERQRHPAVADGERFAVLDVPGPAEPDRHAGR